MSSRHNVRHGHVPLRRPRKRPAQSLRSTLFVSTLLLLLIQLTGVTAFGSLVVGGGGKRSAVIASSPNLFGVQQQHHHQDRTSLAAATTNKPLTSTSSAVIFKFGGSSLADFSRVDHVAKLILDEAHTHKIQGVVCSAMGKTTNALLEAGQKALEDHVVDMESIKALHVETMDACSNDNGGAIPFNATLRAQVMELLDECHDLLRGIAMIQELSPKTKDQLVSYGERCSVRIMAGRIQQLTHDDDTTTACPVMSWDVGVHTDSNFGDAGLVPDYQERIRNGFQQQGLLCDDSSSVIPIVTGFLGHDPHGRITTLGRGGSDLTATALGAALNVDEIQVWKDVDGILSCDPRLVPQALPLSHVSFQQASELAYFGAQVLHPIAMQPAWKSDVPVRVKNSYNRNAVGTIVGRFDNKENNGQQSVNGHRKDDNPSSLVTAITYKREVTVMDIHSTQMLGAYGFLARVFSLFEDHRLSVDVLASSEVSISLTLDQKQRPSAIAALSTELSERSIAHVTTSVGRSIVTIILGDAGQDKSSVVLAQVFEVFAANDIQVLMMSQGASKVNISFVVRDDQLNDAIRTLHASFYADALKMASASSKEENIVVAQ